MATTPLSTLKYSLLIASLLSYTISSTLLRTRLISFLLSLKFTPNSRNQLSTLFLTLLEIFSSYTTLRLLLPTPPSLLSLPIFPLLSLSSTPLPLLLPYLLELYNFQFHSLPTLALYTVGLASGHEIIVRTVKGLIRKELGRKGAKGVELRGKSTPSTISAVIESASAIEQAVDTVGDIECSICLSPADQQELESFCSTKSCKNPVHRSCALSWFHSIPSTSSFPPSPPIPFPGNPNQTEARNSNNNIFTILTSPPGLVSNEVSNRLVEVLVGYGFEEIGNIQVSIDSVGRITGRGGRRRISSPRDVREGDEEGGGCWGLGRLERITVEERFGQGEKLEPVKGVEIYLDGKFVELRRRRKQLWWWRLGSEEQKEIRDALIVGEGGEDPIIGRIISSSPRAACPFCRNSMEFLVHLLPPPPSSSLAIGNSSTLKVKKFFWRVMGDWKKWCRAIGGKVVLQVLMMGFIKTVGMSRLRKMKL